MYRNMKGFIYRIYNSQLSYYGSSKSCVSIEDRLRKHQADYYKYNSGKYKVNYLTSFKIFDMRTERYEIELLEELDEPEDQLDLKLRQREAYYITNNECVNKNIPYRSDEEKRQEKNRRQREYKKRLREKKKQQKEDEDVEPN